MNKADILAGLVKAVVDMDTDAAINLSRQALQAGIPAEEAIENGLAHGMEKVGELFASGEYFIPEVVVCSDAMYAGLGILKPALDKVKKPRGKVVIGVVEGDTHDIGKNLVAIMLEAAGFEIYDLGRNVPLSNFAERAMAVDADIIALSSLMTTTMTGMKVVVDDLVHLSKDRKRFVIVGGAPLSLAFADRIGADGYAANAAGAVKLVSRLLDLGE
ncbi:MAG: corrinoid protein [Syntrophomonadaceae bacterium]